MLTSPVEIVLNIEANAAGKPIILDALRDDIFEPEIVPLKLLVLDGVFMLTVLIAFTNCSARVLTAFFSSVNYHSPPIIFTHFALLLIVFGIL